MPSVRIPDGNLLRILNAALRESLRYLLFQRRVREIKIDKNTSLKVFSYPPRCLRLLRACEELITKTSAVILYPDPPLRTGLYEAAKALVADKAPNVRLLTPETIATLEEINS